VRAWQVTIDGVEPTLSYADGLGNRVDLVRHERGAKPEDRRGRGRRRRDAGPAGILGNQDGYAPPWIFERETALTKAGDTVRELTQALPIEPHSLDALHWLMTEVHGRIAYAPNLTDAPVDAETALQNGEGTAAIMHAFIAAARALKVPARYISGYVLADGAMQRMADSKQSAADGEQEEMLALQSADGMQQVLGASHAARSQPLAALGAYATGRADAAAGRTRVGRGSCRRARLGRLRSVRTAARTSATCASPSASTIATRSLVTGLGASTVGVEISVVQSPELV
jgi:hypothetical protein